MGKMPERMPEEGKGRKEGSPMWYPDPRAPGPARAPTLLVSQGPSDQACKLGAQGAPAEPTTSPPIALPPDFQPKVQSRLVGGSGTCEGSVEVRQGKQWDALCDSSSAKGMARWEDVCREQQCGNVSSYQLLDTGEKTSGGFVCPPGKLSQCHQLLQKKSHCKRVFVTCELGPAHGGWRVVLDLPSKTQSMSTFLKNRPQELNREPWGRMEG